MLHLIGLGLGSAKDITVKGLETVKQCDRIYLESYTSILPVELTELEELYERSFTLADRELVENEADSILPCRPDENVAFLVVGDPFGATTHTDLVLRAREKNIRVNVIHNASILTAVGSCGLQLYSFGETVSIPYWTEDWRPDSFHARILANRKRGLHTLCLLDIKVKEPTLESICRKKKEYQPPRFMSVAEAARQLLSVIEESCANIDEALNSKSLCVGLARIGSTEEKIIVGTLEELSAVDLGPPLHSLVVPARKLHPLEAAFLQRYANDTETMERLVAAYEDRDEANVART